MTFRAFAEVPVIGALLTGLTGALPGSAGATNAAGIGRQSNIASVQSKALGDVAAWFSDSLQPKKGEGPSKEGSQQTPLQQVGSGITYQGQLSSGGQPASGSYDFQFNLYDALTAGNLVRGPIAITQPVTNGLFTVQLDFGAGAFQGSARYLQIAVRPTGGGSFTTLSPRQSLSLVPYAASLVPGAVITGTSGSPILTVNNSGSGSAIYGTTSAGNGTIAGVYGASSDPYGNGVIGQADGPGGYSVSGLSSAGFGVVGSSSSGYGTSGYSSTSRGVYGYSDSYVGVYGENSTDSGPYPAVYGLGRGSAGMGVQAEVISSTLGAFMGHNGGYGPGLEVSSDHGNGVSASSSSGYGVSAISTLNDGVHAQTSASAYSAVYGLSTASNGQAVVGDANSGTGATGVWGRSASGTGVLGEGGFGVYGRGARSSSTAGIYGDSTHCSTCWAGDFDYNVNINGTLFANAKNFRIDDPLDPANKYLDHTSVESSDMLDIYRGHVTLNANGEATVTMPAWFQALNGDFD